MTQSVCWGTLSEEVLFELNPRGRDELVPSGLERTLSRNQVCVLKHGEWQRDL